jgi:VanZ family protein
MPLLMGTFAMLGLIFFFGLRFEGFAFTNNVTWSASGNGLRFGPSGMAYAEVTLPSCREGAECPFTIEMALRPDMREDGRFKIILLLHGGDDAGQLLIGQWRTSLVVMNGDDYDGRQGMPRTGIRNAFSEPRQILVAVTSGPQGTALFLDGKKVRHHRSLQLAHPAAGRPARLIVGNSGYARHSWAGEVMGVALYDRALDAKRIKAHAKIWTQEGAFTPFLKDDPTALYAFTERGGTETRELAGKNPPLAIPPVLKPLQREILAAPHSPRADRTYIEDVLVNLAGFVPLGFLVGAVVTNNGNRSRRWGFVVTVLICFTVSLSIEIAQAWIPSRSSELTDLVLNVAGGGLGYWFVEPVERHLLRPVGG